MKRLIKALLAATIVLLALCCYFVWPPDMCRTSIWLAYERMDNGCEVALRQYWGADFYSTHVLISHPTKGRTTLVIDPDDTKWWFGGIKSDPKQGKLYIYRGFRLALIIDLEREHSYYPGREHYERVPWLWLQDKTNTWGKYLQ